MHKMHGKTYRLIRLAGIITLILITQGKIMQAQNFDYDSYPKLDFNLISLELNLGLQPQNLNLDGAATYQLEANISGADTIILQAARLDISSVTVDDEQVEFSLQNDSLFIPLSQPSEAGDRHELYIRYSGNPTFGLLKNHNGTVWTSQLPRTQRHWIPIIDNPHETLEIDLEISVPSGYTVLASGRQTELEEPSVDVSTYHFSSEHAIPATAFSFSVGEYGHDSVSSGGRSVSLSVEQELSDSVNTQELLQAANDIIQEIENELQVDYPYGDLDIVVMDDHMWETKNWGASSVFLYTNQGNLRTQLLRGLMGQWYGVYQREITWAEGDIINLQQVIIQQALADSTAELLAEGIPTDTLETSYENFSPQRWNSWQQGFSDWQEESVQQIIVRSQDEAFQELPRIVSWDDYARFWYRHSGQPLFEAPVFSSSYEESPAEEETDSVHYEVNYSLNDTEDQLTLQFSALEGNYEKLTTLEGYKVYANKTDTTEVTFTGTEDSVVIQVSPMINNFILSVPEGLPLRFEEYKPASFLLHELRNGDSVEQQAQAARKLGHHSENSDLQLAIRDYLNNDLEPEVRAALLRSLAEITQGAAGTENTFLEALDHQNQRIRDAALMSLQHYPNNATVYNRVEQLALNAEERDTFEKATQVLTALSNVDEFESFAKTVLQQDATGDRAIFVVQEMANMGAVDEAVDIASNFLNDDYSYDIRSRGLGILIQHITSPKGWLNRAERLISDHDPRIRYLFVEALGGNLNQELIQFLKDNIQDEFDARVFDNINRVLNGQSAE